MGVYLRYMGAEGRMEQIKKRGVFTHNSHGGTHSPYLDVEDILNQIDERSLGTYRSPYPIAPSPVKNGWGP